MWIRFRKMVDICVGNSDMIWLRENEPAAAALEDAGASSAGTLMPETSATAVEAPRTGLEEVA